MVNYIQNAIAGTILRTEDESKNDELKDELLNDSKINLNIVM